MARYLVILIVVCSMFSLNAEAYGAYTLVKDVFSGEGAAQISASASYKLQGTLGQNPEPGIPRSTNYVIYEGFWNAEGMGVPPIFVKNISDKIICGKNLIYIPVELEDDKTPLNELEIKIVSSDTDIIPNNNIKVSDTMKEIIITPQDGIKSGSTDITLTVTDADHLSISESFKFTAVNNLDLGDVISILQVMAAEAFSEDKLKDIKNIRDSLAESRIKSEHAVFVLDCITEQ